MFTFATVLTKFPFQHLLYPFLINCLYIPNPSTLLQYVLSSLRASRICQEAASGYVKGKRPPQWKCVCIHTYIGVQCFIQNVEMYSTSCSFYGQKMSKKNFEIKILFLYNNVFLFGVCCLKLAKDLVLKEGTFFLKVSRNSLFYLYLTWLFQEIHFSLRRVFCNFRPQNPR